RPPRSRPWGGGGRTVPPSRCPAPSTGPPSSGPAGPPREPRGRAMSRRVVCWRHGQTLWNVEHRFQGHTDIPLDETGIAQAQRAASLLAALRPSMIVSSDLRRAADTAAALAEITGLEVILDKDLRERGGGEWEGLTREQIAAG